MTSGIKRKAEKKRGLVEGEREGSQNFLPGKKGNQKRMLKQERADGKRSKTSNQLEKHSQSVES